MFSFLKKKPDQTEILLREILEELQSINVNTTGLSNCIYEKDREAKYFRVEIKD